MATSCWKEKQRGRRSSIFLLMAVVCGISIVWNNQLLENPVFFPTTDDPTLIVADATESMNTTTIIKNVRQYHSFWKYPLPPLLMSKQTRAVALLSMGPAAADSTLVERCLISIRTRGQYDGPVLLVTDAPLSRYDYLTKEDLQLIVLHPLPKDWNWELRRDLPYKRFKTYLLEYLHRDDRLAHVEVVYYLDIDVVVGRPLGPWFDHVEQTYMNNNQSQMALFDGNISPLQGGQFVLRRGHSQACLQRWRSHMDAHTVEHKDQFSLTIMWNEQQRSTTNCTLIKMPQSPHLEFLSTRGMSQQHDEYATLLHIKNTQHANAIPDHVQHAFFEKLLREIPPDVLLYNITRRRRIRPNRTWSALQMGITVD